MDGKGKLYLVIVRRILERIEEEEGANIEKGASILAQTIENAGLVHVFGTGHSHIFAEEAFFRAGGLACVNPMLEPSLMLHAGAMKSSVLENCNGIAGAVLDHFDPHPSDALLLFSNSGVNAVPVEVAILAKKRGIPVIAVGSRKYIEYLKETTGKQSIMEHCDVFIDNKGEIGDASVEISELGSKVGPTSTVAGIVIMHLLFIGAVSKLIGKNFYPPIFVSGNFPGGKEKNRKLVQQYRSLVKML